ncbi:hypothetical protein [Acanthopleuribacter pedis]|uniref:Lipoprotein n=1 Tax=Acanthopleuribacter pedis TaxID=442870 RepID=A0A8J7QPF5_9BACT|nr:hypothetical protein [Acanthopleuribacter pedis]MBO1322223.1 hypothetical protein [Acanthopleuribacter pedis]
MNTASIRSRVMGAAVCVLMLQACGGSRSVNGLKETIERFSEMPEYSIILDDMKVEGNFVKTYLHRYRVYYAVKIPGQTEDVQFLDIKTELLEVPEDVYKRHEPDLGMVIAMKTSDGRTTTTPQPAGYQYVGNPRYGQWQTNSSGETFWSFYGKYALLRDAFDVFDRPFKRKYYNNYHNNYYKNKTPYYGSGKVKTYGTYGTRTQKTRPNFYQRAQQRQAQKKSSFSKKVADRTYGRSVTRSSNTTRTSTSRSTTSRTSRSRMSSSRSRGFSRGGK